MNRSEKFYREYFDLPKDETPTLGKDDWDKIKLLENFRLSLNADYYGRLGKKAIPVGDFHCNKQRLIEHLNLVQSFIDALDKTMEMPSTVERGKKIAQLSNALRYSLHSIKHFELNVPLSEELNKMIPVL